MSILNNKKAINNIPLPYGFNSTVARTNTALFLAPSNVEYIKRNLSSPHLGAESRAQTFTVDDNSNLVKSMSDWAQANSINSFEYLTQESDIGSAYNWSVLLEFINDQYLQYRMSAARMPNAYASSNAASTSVEYKGVNPINDNVINYVDNIEYDPFAGGNPQVPNAPLIITDVDASAVDLRNVDMVQASDYGKIDAWRVNNTYRWNKNFAADNAPWIMQDAGAYRPYDRSNDGLPRTIENSSRANPIRAYDMSEIYGLVGRNNSIHYLA